MLGAGKERQTRIACTVKTRTREVVRPARSCASWPAKDLHITRTITSVNAFRGEANGGRIAFVMRFPFRFPGNFVFRVGRRKLRATGFVSTTYPRVSSSGSANSFDLNSSLSLTLTLREPALGSSSAEADGVFRKSGAPELAMDEPPESIPVPTRTRVSFFSQNA